MKTINCNLVAWVCLFQYNKLRNGEATPEVPPDPHPLAMVPQATVPRRGAAWQSNGAQVQYLAAWQYSRVKYLAAWQSNGAQVQYLAAWQYSIVKYLAAWQSNGAQVHYLTAWQYSRVKYLAAWESNGAQVNSSDS